MYPFGHSPRKGLKNRHEQTLFARILRTLLGLGKENMNRFLSIIFILYCVLPVAFAQEEFDEATATDLKDIFLKGDHTALGKMLATNVHLYIPSLNEYCSATHSTRVLRDFFLNQKSKAFEIQQKGTTPPPNNTLYMKALYVTEETSFNVFMMFKDENGKRVIHKLSIKEQQQNE